jgi:uncharacterized protein (UPF0335 family)
MYNDDYEDDDDYEGNDHNTTMEPNSKDQLRRIVTAIEVLIDEGAFINDQKKEFFAEAKTLGFDNKAIRKIIAERKKEQHVLEEEKAILQTYRKALGPLSETPLGQFARRQEGADK